jgi:deazaflavin-dependent oxidoreductase (nitroreductase family)
MLQGARPGHHNGRMATPGSLRRVDPTAPGGLIYRLWMRFLATRLAALLSMKIVWRLDPYLLRVTRGRLGLGLGLPTALLETRGARTGQPRRNGVIYFHDGERVTIVASKLGAPEDPSWYYNARRNPDVVLGGHPFRAALVENEDERARLWELADQVFPVYAVYRERAAAAGRTIPILQLTPR